MNEKKMNDGKIRLGDDFTLYRFAPENAGEIKESVEVNDIFADWKKRGFTVDRFRDDVALYVDYLCSDKTRGHVLRNLSEEYGIFHNDHFCVTSGGEWIGTLSHRRFRSPLDERRF